LNLGILVIHGTLKLAATRSIVPSAVRWLWTYLSESDHDLDAVPISELERAGVGRLARRVGLQLRLAAATDAPFNQGR
jgi:hypothetical protein